MGEIQRRRQMAQALQTQGSTPIEQPPTAPGGFTPRVSPYQGMAKMLQSYLGARGNAQATEQEKALGQKYQSDLAQTLMQAQQAGAGSPGSPQPSEELGGGPAQPPQAPDRQAMARILMGHPATQPMAMQQMMQTPQSMLGKIDPKDYTPNSFQQFMATGNPAVLKANNKLHFADTGVGIQGVDPTTGAPVGQPLAKGVTPDAAANLEFKKMEFSSLSANQKAHLEQEAQRIGISKQQLEEGRVQLVQDNDGNVHLINKISRSGTTATGANGQPLNIPKPLTETQGKANLFGSRAENADKIMRELEDKISTTGLATKRGLENVPLVGGALGAVGNTALSANQQKVEQAQRDFVNAVLRVESGAAISQSEFDNAIKQYFPRPGDTTQVIEQKRANRATAISGLRAMSGPSQRRSSDQPNPEIEAIIAKYATNTP